VGYRAKAEELLVAWDEFEKRAPLDPRITHEMLFSRAILHTKLSTLDHYAAAAREYEKILDRGDQHSDIAATTGNLAETYMMMGRLDDAIDMYRRAVTENHDPGPAYGLAVALDRNDQGQQARELILDLGAANKALFDSEVKSLRWFFTPPGEQYYYRALIEESFGDIGEAIADYRNFIASGAHPQFQGRAREHIADLQAHPERAKPDE
jgi:tetratricopeptide (TPR) repeat protein